MTSFDLAVIVFELQQVIKEVRIEKIYQTSNKTLLFKLRSKRLNLIVEAGKRIHLTKFLIKKPPYPSPFCRALRKRIQNGVIKEIQQEDFERIIIFEIAKGREDHKLIFELFKEGNLILLDKNDIILQALTYRRMRDRNVIRGEKYQFPPRLRFSPLETSTKQLESLKDKNSEVVRALTSLFGIGGLYAEEVLKKSGVKKDKIANTLTNVEIVKIHEALSGLITDLKLRKFNPIIVVNQKGEDVDVLPFSLSIYDGYLEKKHSSFNEAVDEYFTKVKVKGVKLTSTKEVENRTKRHERILEQQQAKLRKLQIDSVQNRIIGDLIFAHLTELDALLSLILNQRRSGVEWDEIVTGVTGKKINGIQDGIVESVNSKKGEIIIRVGKIEAILNFRKTPQQNAAIFYERSKKQKRKIKGAEKAIANTKEKLESIQVQRKELAKIVRQPVIIRKKAWYEKFHWFQSSDNNLVIGGRDATTNEILIKRHMKDEDIVLHADFQGAPFVLIKTKKKSPSEKELLEAAQFAASYSKAWRTGLSSVDVYWVKPEQVSKEPPSGQYLPKGAFMIRGKKNYFKNVPLQISIGIIEDNEGIKAVSGPQSAIISKTKFYVNIVPGNKPSKKVAEEIKTKLVKKTQKKLHNKITLIPVEEIQRYIPAGKSDIAKS